MRPKPPDVFQQNNQGERALQTLRGATHSGDSPSSRNNIAADGTRPAVS
jgi:hypothetical protein